MTDARDPIDVVRASRDGHQFHEAWAARAALELLPPDATLTALAIEGFSSEEASEFSNEAHDIADLVRYRGGKCVIAATRIETLQFKYSIAAASKPMRASEMVKTLRKFAAADADVAKIRPLEPEISTYELVTNRPIDAKTIAGLHELRQYKPAESALGDQPAQLKAAIGLEGDALQSFAKRLTLTGAGGSLDQVEHGNLRALASWAGATDNLSRARLANLRKLVRDRAGGAGQRDNLIGRVDVLGALDIAHERELYPVRAAFPPIETQIERPILTDLISALFAGDRALLVHAAGGIGKTVLMQALAKRLADRHCVLLFDGFGAGMWREPSDGRHLPRKSLPHLTNLLAADGLCDILFQSSHFEDSLGAFRDRVTASVQALRTFDADANIVLVLDAIDHCGMQAERTASQSFAQLLLQSLNVAPINGVRVVASCRTHRRELAQGDARCREFEVPVFTREETEKLVCARYLEADRNDITVLQRRSGGNPRLLDNLLRRGPPFDVTRPDNQIEMLEALLREQISNAEEQAIARGATAAEARGLLAGMAMLPPPAPIEELAAALGLASTDVESFVADLFPLIEATPTGLIFRDEPTETLVVELIGGDVIARSDLVGRLQTRQSHSIYAARALPGILAQTGAVDALVALAFDPLAVPNLSRVARRAIRLARLEAAASACARGGRIDDLTRLAVEASRVASATERSDSYLRSHPDLVALSDDVEAIRRFRDDRSGWVGMRHASLAVLDAFSGDLHSAALESDRALTWFNWWVRERREGRSQDRRDVTSLEAEAIFVQLLLGKAIRVDRWLATLKDPYAFKIAADMLGFIDRLAQLGSEGAPARDVIGAIESCRTKSPAVIGAITARLEIAPEIRRRLLARLATLRPEPTEAGSYIDCRRTDRLADALVSAAGQAVGLGLLREAQAIAAHAQPPDLRAHEVDDPWPVSGGKVARHLKLAAIATAARRRPTTVTDILPVDMSAIVPSSVRRQGPAAFERRLLRLISAARNERGKKAKSRPDGEEALRWERLLSHRLRPLVPFVDDLVAILIADEPRPALSSALQRATAAIASAENYPYRDQVRFLRHLLLDVLRWAAACRAPLDRSSGDMLAAFLEQSGSQIVSDWLQMVRLLARGPETQAAALRLARQAERVFAEDTNITEQIRCYGALARALLPISPDEARPYFKIGLELADAVGSDDQERISDFISLTAQYSGEPLAPETVHQFVRLCELNFPDEAEAFDWRSLARALTAISGAAGLAPISRLADRDKIDLGWTLPPMLMALVERDRLRPTLAAGLIGTAPFESTWDWFPPEAAKVILPRLPAQLRERFAEMLVVDLDREDATQIRSEALRGYQALFNAELPPQASARTRIAALHTERTRRDRPDQVNSKLEVPVVPERLRGAMVIPGDELRAAIEEGAAATGGHRPTDGFILQRFVSGITDPTPRAALLAAVALDSELGFRDKVYFLEETHERWRGQSRALDAQLDAAAVSVALRHLDEVVRPGESWRRPLSRIARLAGSDRHRLVAVALEAMPGQSLDVSGDFWMSCAIELARSASAEAIGDAVARYTIHATASLPDAIGDGSWSSSFATEHDSDAIIADLLWMRLGAPEAASRWRAAHAVRRLVALGETTFVDPLIARLDREDAGAFQDRSLPFFHLHARLWLLITVARVAREVPECVIAYRSALEVIATSESFPHVLCRHFAILALRALAEAGTISDREAYLVWLDTLNVPALPRAPHSDRRPGFYDTRPKDRPERKPPFRFDYDFDKYQVDSIGRLFGLPKWDVEDGTTDWIRRYDAKIESMYDCSRPRWSNDDRSYGSTSFPDVDRYGGYLAWHSLSLTAGQFAKDRPISGDSWEDTPWESWLSEKTLSRADGLWLADGIDLFPLEDRRPVVSIGLDERSSNSVPRHPLDLLPLAGFDDSLATPDSFLISGSWDSADGLDVTIGSQLVARDHARAVAHAVYSSDPFFAYLRPDEDSDDGFDRRKGREKQLLTRWLVGDQHTYAKLDEHDPYGHPTALRRVRPSAEIAAKMGVRQADPFGRTWINTAGRTIFHAEAWGTRRGRGRHATERGGNRVSVAWSALAPMLQAEKQALLLLIKFRRYIEKDPKDDHFRHQMLALIVRHDQPVEIVWSVPAQLRALIARLGQYERGEFIERLAAAEALVLRRQSWPRQHPRAPRPPEKS